MNSDVEQFFWGFMAGMALSAGLFGMVFYGRIG